MLLWIERSALTSKDLLSLKQGRIEVGRWIDLVKAVEEGFFGIRKDLLKVGCLLCRRSLRCIRKDEALVAIMVDEQGHLGKVALLELVGREVADLRSLAY